MTRMPGAVWRPISINYGLIRAGGRIDRTARRPRGTNACIFHVDAMNSPSLVGWFNNPAARASSHLYTLKTGVIEQMIDLDHVSWCNGDGDLRAITVETQGRDGEPWTPQQVESNARIAAFVHDHYGVPLRLMEDSRTTTAGLGWHRLGIEGNFRGSELQRRQLVPGGERWSRSKGKTCPGNDRIAQMPQLLARAQQIAGLGVGGITIPPVTIPEGHLDMHPDELNRHLSRHAENVVAALTERLPATINEARRIQVNVQNTALHNMVRRELALAIGSVPGVDVPDLAGRLAALLEDDLIDAVTNAVRALPDADREQIKAEVRQDIAHRLSQED